MNSIKFHGDIDAFWKYRTARMTFEAIRTEIDITPETFETIRKYVESNGHQCDNHICWKSGNTYFMFSDWVLKIGDSIIEENW